ncbi:MAG: sugar phosphate isomerase/epimerase [Sediminicola sp.]
MGRRKFIQQSGLLCSAALLPLPSFAWESKPRFKMGLQLFTVRDAMEKDPVSTLRTVASLGYQDLETYGYNGEKGLYYGMESAHFKQLLDDLQLTASSGHYGFSDQFEKPNDQMERFVDQCIEGAHALGKSYITWPWLAPHQRSLDSFKLLSAKLNSIGERVNKAGLGFAYHNHDFEFVEHDGAIGYDIILAETDPALVKLQMDLYWVVRSSKKSPKQWVAEQPGRYVMWHIKDMDKITEDYTELGNGSIDYNEVLPDPVASGLEFYYLEQGGNFAQNSMQSITDSATYFKRRLQRYL